MGRFCDGISRRNISSRSNTDYRGSFIATYAQFRSHKTNRPRKPSQLMSFFLLIQKKTAPVLTVTVL